MSFDDVWMLMMILGIVCHPGSINQVANTALARPFILIGLGLSHGCHQAKAPISQSCTVQRSEQEAETFAQEVTSLHG